MINIKRFSITNIISRSYRDHVRDGETLKMLNTMILAVAVGMILFTANGGAAFTGLASAIGTGEFAFGMIFAMPVFAGLLQLYVSHLVEKTGKCKRMFMIGGVIQRIAWFCVAFIPYVFPVTQSRVFALIVLVTLAAMAGSFTNVTFLSMMAVVVPIEIRGRYITVRQRVMTFVSLVTGLCIAFILDNAPGFLGYTIIFAVGGIAGLIDILMFWKAKFPEVRKDSSEVTLFKGMKECFSISKTRNYMIFWMLWNFAAFLSAPFGTKYAIDVLSLSFVSIIIFGQITANIITVTILHRWGVLIDRYGSTPLLMISTLVTSLSAFVWLFAVPGNIWPLFIINIIGGFFWCANEACAASMQFSHTPERGRSIALAVYVVGTAVSSAAAMAIGGAVLETLNPIMKELDLTVFGTPFDHYKVIFSVSAVLRIAVVLIFLTRVWNEKGYTLRQAYKRFFDDTKSRWQYEKRRFRFPKFWK
ncbi:MAG: MFS transporter [Oscillospiraceae bacterium]|nr:MFS transporter [Oscillospiraceae bacterium]